MDNSTCHEDSAHWEDVRERAAIAAMQATITLASSYDHFIFRDFVWDGNDRRCPEPLADFAVACADALVERLRSVK